MLKVYIQLLDRGSALCLEGQVVKGEGISTLKAAVLSQANMSAIILDLAMVDTIDAAGLGTLLDLREWAQENGIEFNLRNANSRVAHVFRIARLDSVFGIASRHEVCLSNPSFDNPRGSSPTVKEGRIGVLLSATVKSLSFHLAGD